MKKLLILSAALAFAATAQAQIVEVRKRTAGTVTSEVFIPKQKKCVKTGEADIVGGVAGGAIGAGAGALAGRWLLGKNGGTAGGLLGAGAGAMLGGGEKEKCTEVDAHWLVDVTLKDGRELTATVQTSACKANGFDACYKKGSELTHTVYSDGTTNLR